MISTVRFTTSLTLGSNHDVNLELIQPSQESSKSITSAKLVLWRLYLSHTLSTWNARTFEFGAVVFLAAIFPGTLFYTSLYALFRSAAATLLSSWIGKMVDQTHRLSLIRHTIVWARCSVGISCLLLLVLLPGDRSTLVTLVCFTVSIGMACIEKLAFIGNTVSIERDWIIVVSDSLGLERQDVNSSMRRIDLVCKLVAPLCISLVDTYSTKVAIMVVLGQNTISVVFEYFAIARVFFTIPELARGKGAKKPQSTPNPRTEEEGMTGLDSSPILDVQTNGFFAYMLDCVQPYKDYVHNPAFLASFSLSLLYLTVLSFGTQMTTYLLTLKFTSVQISVMRVAAVVLELSATCAAPMLMKKIGPVRSGLWFVNEQLMAVALALGLFSTVESQTQLAGAALIFGVTLSRLGLWGFDLCVQFLVQEDAPADSRGSFSAVEIALQNGFELTSYAITIIFHQPEEFKYPVFISAGAIAISAACFASFVRQKRGHLLHASKCFKRQGKAKYQVLPTIEEELESFSNQE